MTFHPIAGSVFLALAMVFVLLLADFIWQKRRRAQYATASSNGTGALGCTHRVERAPAAGRRDQRALNQLCEAVQALDSIP